MRPLMVELCAGTGTMAAAFRALGWRTLTVDVDARHKPDVCADVRALGVELVSEVPGFVWASPPCPEFSRHDQPWTKARNPPEPDMTITRACVALIVAWSPPWWCVENVRGAGPWYRPILGRHVDHIGRAHWLYGRLPVLGKVPVGRQKQSRSSEASVSRSAYAPESCAHIARAVDDAVRLLGVERLEVRQIEGVER